MKSDTLRKLVSGVFVGLALLASATAPDAPHLTTQAYVNGKLNVGIWWYSTDYNNKSGTSLKSAGLSYDVQMKGPGETAFSDVGGSWETFEKNNYVFRCWYLATNYVGSATLRVRARNSDGETSDWVETDPLAATINVTGTPIYSAGCGGVPPAVNAYANAFDGRIGTMVDGTGNSGNDMGTGYLFDSATRIKGIRYLARLDHLTLAGRYQSSVFQIASDATFSDATTIYTVPATYTDITRMTEVYFDEPVTCRAIRHWKEKGGYEQSAEVEYIPADPPFKPVLTITPGDLTNFYPVISWTLPADAACSSCRLQRSFQSEGPFVDVTADLDPQTDALTYTDTNSYVGVAAYYRVLGVCQHPLFQGETCTSVVASYTRARRLDRAWGAETTLLSGVSVLPGTNGVMRSGLWDHARCFDGNTSTFVDEYQDAAFYPPIGLKFSEATWVSGFGYICRNDNVCYARVKNARLYAANDYPELTDRVAVSAFAARASQDTTLYYQACTSIPSAGATNYFLYGSGEFYGNVAEVMMFGWTEADALAAPVVTAPKEITFVHRGLELDVSWTAGANATQYTLERRVRGTENWTTVVSETADLSYTETSLEQDYYEYRVTAQGDLGTATSEVFLYPFYHPASGTGLSGVVMWPYDSRSASPTQLVNEVARGPEPVNYALAAGAEVVSGVTAGMRFAWEGKVVAPFAGLYTFSLDTDAGGAVFIDHVSVANSWTGGTKSPTGTISLTAGEHAIRVDYRANDSGLSKRCILRWGGVVADEIIPASQLIAAETPPSARMDGWTCHVYGQNICGHFEKRTDGRYLVTGTKQELGTLAALNLTAMMKPWSGSFDCQMYIEPGNAYGKCGFVVQNEDGQYLLPVIRTVGANDFYGMRVYNPASGSYSAALSWVQYNWSNQPWCWLRLTRLGATFTMYWKKSTADEWTQVATWLDESKMFGRDIYLGMGVSGGEGENPAQFYMSQFSVKAMSGGTVLLFR